MTAADPGLQASGFFVLRTPLLPIETVLEWARAGEEGGDEARLEYLRRALARPEVAEALFLASESLHDALQAAHEAGGELPRNVLLSLVRYLVRMASRPTPFGLLAGYSAGTVGAGVRLELPPAGSYERSTQVGIEHIDALCRRLARQPCVREAVALRPNSSLYELAGQYRYVEIQPGGDGPGHVLQAVRAGRELAAVLELAEGGTTAGSLAARLAGELGAPLEAAASYVEQLVDNQVLVPDLEPPVTGRLSLHEVADHLAALPDERSAGDARTLRDELSRIDAAGVGVGVGEYREVRARAASLFGGDTGLSRILHGELRKPADGLRLGTAVTQDFAAASEMLRQLFGQREDPLQTFQERFYDRYEQRFVPLHEALDEELGIGLSGYGEAAADEAPLLQGVHFPPPPDATATWLPVHRGLLGKLGSLWRSDDDEIVFTPEEVERFACPQPAAAPDAFAAIGNVAARDAEALDRGDYRIFIFSAVGPSGVKIIGRFLQTDPSLNELAVAHLRSEEGRCPQAAFAEVVNLPQGRSANIVTRPVLRDYEIPYLGLSGAPRERQIPVSDLLVGVRAGRIVLWSRRLDREVVPRVTSAHNYRSHGVATYRFLAALQHHRMASALYWDWGPLADLPFLPRVRVGRIVLSLATWLVPQAELRPLLDVSPVKRSAAAARLRERHRLPRFATLVEDDQELLVDFENPLLVEAFADTARGKETAILREPFPAPDELAVTGPEGRFVSQVVVPFVRTGEPHPAPPGPPAAIEGRRMLPLLSSWLYLKLYTGYSTADRLLVDVVAPLAGACLADGSADSWFFVRYRDTDFHLRLRLHATDEAAAGRLLERASSVLDPLLAAGLLARLQLETYTPELERYGGAEGLALAERIFWVDSETTTALLPLARLNPDLRWQLAAYSSERLFDELGYSLEDKARLLRTLVELYAREFRRDRGVRRELAKQTRRRRDAVERLTASAADQPWHGVYEARRRRLAPLAAEMHRLSDSGALQTSLDEYVASLLHMHLNRWFRSSPRAQELVLYDLLHRVALSALARAEAAAC